jgi:cytochrome c-L
MSEDSVRSSFAAKGTGLALATGLSVVGLAVTPVSLLAQGPGIQFRHALDNAPLKVPLPAGANLTEAVIHFRNTGTNAYVGDATAIAAGKQVYNRWCQSCHLPDASGRMGPSLVDDQVKYARGDTDVGMFEIIYGGAAGAMQAFGNRISQDDILKVIAYLRSRKK